MKNIIENMEEILNCHVSGFHKYILQEPYHLDFVSQNFCEIIGYTQKELLSNTSDLYAPLVHPADKQIYSDFLHNLSIKEQTISVQYRIIKKDGVVKYVNDTATSKRLEDGTFVGYSILTDITSLKTENDNLRFLNETVPFGFLKYTCEKQPKVTYINEQMLKILRFSETKDGELDYLEMYKNNIYLLVPIEQQRKFSNFLNRVYNQDAPISGEMTVHRCDGSKVRLYGWVTKCINDQGKEEFQSVCMDITEKYKTKKASEMEQYLKALKEVYDEIFEYDFSNNTMKFVHGQKSDAFKFIQNVPMYLKEATEQWIESSVFKNDRMKMHNFFNYFYQHKYQESEAKPPQIKFRLVGLDGEIKEYSGIFLKIDHSVSLFCCRAIIDVQENDILRNENISLKNMNENMQELVMRFTEGIAAFEVTNDSVTPLYASDNVCEFFGFTIEEWIPMMKKSNSIKTFISRSGVDYEDFIDLLENGEAEFNYFDVKSKTLRRIKAICSQKFSDGSSPRYVMLYNVNDDIQKDTDIAFDNDKIYIRTFGYFDVFVGEKPIAFRNKKSKELFALLVDRRGGYVSSEEAISFLWEDEPVSPVTLARYRKVALRLKNILEEYGIVDVVESVDGKRRIVRDKVRCDLYDYLSQKEEFSQLFKGSYLTNYSWGETTLGELINENEV